MQRGGRRNSFAIARNIAIPYIGTAFATTKTRLRSNGSKLASVGRLSGFASLLHTSHSIVEVSRGKGK